MTDSDVNDDDNTVQSITTSLLVRAKQQDEKAWKQLVDIYGPVVYEWCRRSRLSEHDAGDVSQEVFKAVARSLQNFERGEDEGSFVRWLRTITKSKVIDHRRRSNKQPNAKGGSAAQSLLDNSPFEAGQDDSDESQTRTTVRRMLEFVKDRISDRDWKIVYMLFDGKTAAEVGEEFDMNPANVYNIRSRVMRKLREYFMPDSAEENAEDESE